jgi:hypothetical protein
MVDAILFIVIAGLFCMAGVVFLAERGREFVPAAIIAGIVAAGCVFIAVGQLRGKREPQGFDVLPPEKKEGE